MKNKITTEIQKIFLEFFITNVIEKLYVQLPHA